MPLNTQDPVFTSVATVATASEATIYTPASGKRFILNKMLLSVDTTGLYTFKDTTAPAGTVSTTFGPFELVASLAPVTIDLVPSGQGGGYLGARSGAVSNVLTCTGPGSSHVNGMLISYEE